MKEPIKYKSSFLGQDITYIVDDRMNKLKGKVLAPKKLAAANEALHNLKPPFPEFLKGKL